MSPEDYADWASNYDGPFDGNEGPSVVVSGGPSPGAGAAPFMTIGGGNGSGAREGVVAHLVVDEPR